MQLAPACLPANNRAVPLRTTQSTRAWVPACVQTATPNGQPGPNTLSQTAQVWPMWHGGRACDGEPCDAAHTGEHKGGLLLACWGAFAGLRAETRRPSVPEGTIPLYGIQGGQHRPRFDGFFGAGISPGGEQPIEIQPHVREGGATTGCRGVTVSLARSGSESGVHTKQGFPWPQKHETGGRVGCW